VSRPLQYNRGIPTILNIRWDGNPQRKSGVYTLATYNYRFTDVVVRYQLYYTSSRPNAHMVSALGSPAPNPAPTGCAELGHAGPHGRRPGKSKYTKSGMRPIPRLLTGTIRRHGHTGSVRSLLKCQDPRSYCNRAVPRPRDQPMAWVFGTILVCPRRQLCDRGRSTLHSGAITRIPELISPTPSSLHGCVDQLASQKLFTDKWVRTQVHSSHTDVDTRLPVIHANQRGVPQVHSISANHSYCN